MLTVHVDQPDETILTIEIKFHRARYLVVDAWSAGIKCKIKSTQLGAKDKVPKGAQMVCDTACRIQLSGGGEHIGTLEGFSRMSPVDVGKYNKSRGRKTSLRRAIDKHNMTLAGECTVDLGIDKRARGIIWREYFRNFDLDILVSDKKE